MNLLDLLNSKNHSPRKSILVHLYNNKNIVGEVVNVARTDIHFTATDVAIVRIRKGNGLGVVYQEGEKYEFNISDLIVKVIS